MNKPPGNAPDASGWHHGCCCQPVGEEPGWRGGGGKLPESSLSRRGRRLEDRVRMDSNLTADPSPRLQSATVANIEQGLRRTWERLPGVRQLEGIEGAYFFVDRQRGKAIFISLWESEQSMNNSEEMMRPLRAELSEAFAANSVDVEHYEVGEMLVQEIRERELLEQELEVARSIQQASLPEEVPTLEGWQISPYYQPAREVGSEPYLECQQICSRVSGRLGSSSSILAT